MVATRRAGRHLAPLHQRDAQTAKGEVMRQRASGAAAAHDENVPVVPLGFHLESSLRPDATLRCRRGAAIRSRYARARVLSRDRPPRVGAQAEGPGTGRPSAAGARQAPSALTLASRIAVT